MLHSRDGQPSERPGGWRHPREGRRERLVEIGDLFQLATLLAAELASRFLPERRWFDLGRAAARVSLALLRQRTSEARRQLAVLPNAVMAGRDPDTLLRSILAGCFEERAFFRKVNHHGAWRPTARLQGSEHLEAALARGRGAVIWVAPTVYSTILVKMALHDAGFRVGHLSAIWHGPSRSRVGRSRINARYLAVEERFVERVVIPEHGPTAALKELGRRLGRNQVVTVTATGAADRSVEVPFLEGHLRLAPGAPRLALAHKAPLLAAFTACDRGSDRFEVIVEPLTACGEKSGRDAVQQAARDFASAYGRHITADPTMWNVFLRGGAHRVK